MDGYNLPNKALSDNGDSRLAVAPNDPSLDEVPDAVLLSPTSPSGSTVTYCSRIQSHRNTDDHYANYAQDKLRSFLQYLDQEGQNTEVGTGDSVKCNFVQHGMEIVTESDGKFHQETMEFLDDQEALILRLRLQLNKEAEKSALALHEAQELYQKRLKQQRDMSNGKLKSLQLVLDQCNEEKKVLCERCETISADIKQIQIKYERRAEEQEMRHRDDLKRARSQWEISEKERQKKWIQQRANQIKESTLRSVEPEIERILSLHKDEMRQVQEAYDHHRRKSEETANLAIQEKLSHLEHKFAQRADDIRKQERQLADDLCNQKAAEIEQRLHLELAKRDEEMCVNKQIYEERLQTQADDFVRLRYEFGKEKQKELAQCNEKAKADLTESEQRHQVEIERRLAEVNQSFELWKKDHFKSQDLVLAKKFDEMKLATRISRDAEIAEAMGILASEISRLQLDMDVRIKAKMVRLHEEHQSEVTELQETADRWKVVANNATEQLRFRDNLTKSHQDMQTKLECELRACQQSLEAMKQERTTLLEDTVKTYSERLQNMDIQVQRLTKELAESHDIRKTETDSLQKRIAIMKRENDSALDAISEKVRPMLSKKDAKIDMLRQQLLAVHEQNAQTAVSHNRNKLQPAQIRSISAASRSGSNRHIQQAQKQGNGKS
ncbi:centrosomal protein of 131 kDa-like isoform X2 [Paramacrobiotus metropolitanus]|uniref:centrosomal protein of 131 kDa-like isoform X2 n=1 Tax=Paramacrobiotus metropolitanus TaxID=2943436 RepID=UPI002445ECF0|nr:centrosomal protein of 131 kDa-like isoform X2 [Paramacrobiotus metropolitanus]